MEQHAGHIVDIRNRKIYSGAIIVEEGRISKIVPKEDVPDRYILPGFIDAHIHIESSMVVPYEFARVALGHGTVATVSDPHEIANVMGTEGVSYMINNARSAGLKFHFGAPSCVPATSFETAGAVIDSDEVKKLLESPEIYYLSEMMNYPGVLYGDKEVLKKIEHAQELGKPIDGHAPGLRGDDAKKYASAGISTDHECYTLEEALEKLALGMKIIIREGSAAKNFDALHPIIKSHPGQVMFCSDDKHPDDLLEGHINQLVVKALHLGYDLFDVLKIACINPVEHYGLKSGTLREREAADFIIVSDLASFKVLSTIVDGVSYYHDEMCTLLAATHPIINHFDIKPKSPSVFSIKAKDEEWPIIKAVDGELITEKVFQKIQTINGLAISNIDEDILKIAVVNRYKEASVACGFIQNFGLKKGAIASTVAHDSHNIIAVGVGDHDICRAINLLIQSRGGLSAVSDHEEIHLPLPIAGLMSDSTCEKVGKEYSIIDSFVKSLGCPLSAPFMTLSFMALLVIPKIKMSDLGMFDAEAFKFYS